MKRPKDFDREQCFKKQIKDISKKIIYLNNEIFNLSYIEKNIYKIVQKDIHLINKVIKEIKYKILCLNNEVSNLKYIQNNIFYKGENYERLYGRLYEKKSNKIKSQINTFD